LKDNPNAFYPETQTAGIVN